MSTGYGTDSCRRRPGICLPDMGIRRWKSTDEKVYGKTRIYYIKIMKIIRNSGNIKTTWEIDFSRELKLYNIAKPRDSSTDSSIEHGICVPVVPIESGFRDETYFWDSYNDVTVTVDDNSYILNMGNPKEYVRLVNNLETLFALN